MKPLITRNKFTNPKSYIAESTEALDNGRKLHWTGWGDSFTEAYLDWEERIKCVYAKYDDEKCICKTCLEFNDIPGEDK